MISRKFFKLTTPLIPSGSDQIGWQLVQMLCKRKCCTIFIFNKTKKYQISDIKDNDQRYQLVRCYDISKTSVSFRYQWKRLCDVLNCSISLTYHWYIAMTSQIGLFYLRTSETSQEHLK